MIPAVNFRWNHYLIAQLYQIMMLGLANGTLTLVSMYEVDVMDIVFSVCIVMRGAAGVRVWEV